MEVASPAWSMRTAMSAARSPVQTTRSFVSVSKGTSQIHDGSRPSSPRALRARTRLPGPSIVERLEPSGRVLGQEEAHLAAVEGHPLVAAGDILQVGPRVGATLTPELAEDGPGDGGVRLVAAAGETGQRGKLRGRGVRATERAPRAVPPVVGELDVRRTGGAGRGVAAPRLAGADPHDLPAPAHRVHDQRVVGVGHHHERPVGQRVVPAARRCGGPRACGPSGRARGSAGPRPSAGRRSRRQAGRSRRPRGRRRARRARRPAPRRCRSSGWPPSCCWRAAGRCRGPGRSAWWWWSCRSCRSRAPSSLVGPSALPRCSTPARGRPGHSGCAPRRRSGDWLPP